LYLQCLQVQLLQAAGDDADLELLGRLMLRTSARNQLTGRVRAIHGRGHNDLIDVGLPGGSRLQALITHDSTENLQLSEGCSVVALIKAGWLELQALDQPADPGRNALEGDIEQILPGNGGPSEVRVSLANGQTLCASVEREQLAMLNVTVGDPVRAQFAASQVLLGTQL
jgi:molybdate transport system regulatory protein